MADGEAYSEESEPQAETIKEGGDKESPAPRSATLALSEIAPTGG
jgi:hypothetical protein